MVSEAAGLNRATSRIILRVEVEHNVLLSLIVFETKRDTVGGCSGEIRRLIAGLQICVHLIHVRAILRCSCF
jgi:hypothetical protein